MEISWQELPPGDVPRDNSPLGEYHCIRPDERYAGWDEPVNHWSWKDSNWRVVADDAGRRMLEAIGPSRCNNRILISDAVARGVRSAGVEVFCEQPTGEVGLVFAFHTAIDYLCLSYTDDRVGFSRRRGEHFELLAESAHSGLAGRWVTLGFQCARGRLACTLDGREAFAVRLDEGTDGRVGLIANVPARFRMLKADGRPPRRWPAKAPGEKLPPMKLLRRISVAGFGTGRQLRFGDLTGDGRPDIVLAQPTILQARSRYTMLGALTAIDAEGKVLWQSGEPVANPPLLAGDLPVQVHDVDGDGRAEIVCVRDFQLQYLDGATGRVKFARPLPDHPPHNPLLDHVVTYFGSPAGSELPRPWINAIAFADLAGRGAQRDVLLKDHYHHLWALTPEGEELWSFCGNIGHFPFAADLNGDGRDEVVAGYHTLDAGGRIIESLHFGDHADAVFAGDLQGWGGPKIVRAGGDDGLSISGLGGDLLVVHLGHVQRLAIGNFRPDRPGLEYAICTFWGAPGIVAMIDSAGELLWSRTLPVCGNTLQPVNWTGDGRELMCYSAHSRFGGLFDAEGRRAVAFPDDGHPELCSEVLDLLGGGRDNLIVWDREAIWIYGPAGGAAAGEGRRYCPRRPSLYNGSNYMAYWSIPCWKS